MREDHKELNKVLQEHMLVLDKARNNSRLIRSLLVTARYNLSEAIERLESLLEDI
jgi:hypothetical protein